jgi:excisionase family DNA binding protein
VHPNVTLFHGDCNTPKRKPVNNQTDYQVSPAEDTTLLTVHEVAALLKVHHTSIYRFIKREGLPAFKIGADWRFSKRAIEQWLKDQQSKR